MASPTSSTAFFFFLLSFSASLLVSPSLSLTCTSEKFTGMTFANCTDLPVLDATLHYTYNASNSSLSVAFSAPPKETNGWVAWAINPTSTGMVGSQAFIAFKVDGKLTVKTYDISSHSSVKESKLSFDAWDMAAQSDGEKTVIFASVKVPENGESVNQVWQVGSSVTDGEPNQHETKADNLKAKGVLTLVGGGNSTDTSAPTSTSSSWRSTAGYSIGVVVAAVGAFVGF